MLLATHTVLQEYLGKWVTMIQQNILTMDTGNYIPRAERQKMADSVYYEITDKGGTIYGGQWVFTYEYGRGPTVNDGDGAVRRNALAFIREEGMQASGTLKDGTAIDQETLAFFVSRKIHQQGTILHRTQTQSGVLSEVINQESVQELDKRMFFEIGTQISSRLLEAIA